MDNKKTKVKKCCDCGELFISFVRDTKYKWLGIDKSGHIHEDVCPRSGKNTVVRLNDDICEHHK